MAIIKCKMCGGDMELSADKTFGTCEYCGSTMTLPKTDDDQQLNLFNRGNHLRRNAEFDKALAVYERMVSENDANAEAHWCMVLCRYGIEYVEDPVTHERIPTCHRASFDSILNDVDYQAALRYSDGVARSLYEKEAQKIAALQKDILAISQNEEPFDVFICYKESDENGNRTKDSQLAQDIYYQLTDNGYKVFFARITLEDKLGREYEPYIFAALNSAKIMVVVGTKPEYMNAVWVKNEWSRYLALMRNDRNRLLIPCYRDMDPYDMPEELSMLQSQDMGKIGFVQDLLRGMKKVLDAEKKTEVVHEVVSAAAQSADPLIKRGHIFLEDRDWEKADEYFDKALDVDPENGHAYAGKLCALLRYSKLADMAEDNETWGGSSVDEVPVDPSQTISDLLKQNKKIEAIKALREAKGLSLADAKNAIERVPAKADAQIVRSVLGLQAPVVARDKTKAGNLYEKAVRYGNSALKNELDGLLKQAKDKASLEFRRAKYEQACTEMMKANTPGQYKSAAKLFEQAEGYKEAAARKVKCLEEAEKLEEQLRREAEERAERQRREAEERAEQERIAKEKWNEENYPIAVSTMDKAWTKNDYVAAKELFERIGDYKDSRTRMLQCVTIIREISEMDSQYAVDNPLLSKIGDLKKKIEELKEEYRTKADFCRKAIGPFGISFLLLFVLVGAFICYVFVSDGDPSVGMPFLLGGLVFLLILRGALKGRRNRKKDLETTALALRKAEDELDAAMWQSIPMEEYRKIYSIRATEEGRNRIAAIQHAQKATVEAERMAVRKQRRKETKLTKPKSVVAAVILWAIVLAIPTGYFAMRHSNLEKVKAQLPGHVTSREFDSNWNDLRYPTSDGDTRYVDGAFHSFEFHDDNTVTWLWSGDGHEETVTCTYTVQYDGLWELSPQVFLEGGQWRLDVYYVDYNDYDYGDDEYGYSYTPVSPLTIDHVAIDSWY